MSPRHIPSSRSLWDRHVQGVMRVMCSALEKLHGERNLPTGEKNLDRRLSVKAREAYCGLPKRARPHGFGLVPKAETVPVKPGDVDEEWVGKLPDFTWRMQDDLAALPSDLTRDFHIESKRLGKPTSRTWILTKEYVVDGIVRFLSPSHRYGNGVSSGAMIGYVQDSEPVDLAREVNGFIAEQQDYPIPPVDFRHNDPASKPVMETQQHLERSRVAPANFTLHHVWVDLRSSAWTNEAG